MRRGGWLIALALALVSASPAQAAAPIDLGVGSGPSAVVDPAGTAHIVFQSPGGQTYCRLPRGAAGCDVYLPLELGNRFGKLKIFRRAADGALIVVQAAEDDIAGTQHGVTWMRYSVDNGASWAGPVAIGTGRPRLDDLTLSNDGQSVFSLSEDTDALFFQADSLVARQDRVIDLNAKPDGSELGSAYSGAVVQTPQGRVLVAIDTIDDTRWRAFSGGDPFDQNAWQPFPAKTLRGEGSPRLASGKRGTYLLNERSIAFQRRDLVAPFAIRSYDTRRNRWRAAKGVAEDRAVTGGADLEQDARGRLHVAWATGAGHVACVVYARTGPRSSSWFGRSTTLFRTTSAEHTPQSVAIAAGADGRGVATWGEPGPEPNAGHVHVVALKQRSGRYHRIKDPYKRPYC